MSGYIEAGYIIALVTIFGYGLSVLWRENVARKRLDGVDREKRGSDSPTSNDSVVR